MRKRLVILALVVLIVLVSSAAYMFLSGGENILIATDSVIYTYDEYNPNWEMRPDNLDFGRNVNQSLALHFKNIGTETALIYQINWMAGGWRNWTFSQDIVLPAGVDCIVYIPILGGPVSFETIKAGQGNTPPSGGRYAFSTNSTHGLGAGGVLVLTRAGGKYVGDGVKVEFNGTYYSGR